MLQFLKKTKKKQNTKLVRWTPVHELKDTKKVGKGEIVVPVNLVNLCCLVAFSSFPLTLSINTNRQHGILRFLTLFVPCQKNHQNTQSKIRNVTMYIFGMNIVVKREVSKQFDGSIQVVFCHEALLHKIFQWVIVPLWLYSSTFAMGSIGAGRLLRFSF